MCAIARRAGRLNRTRLLTPAETGEAARRVRRVLALRALIPRRSAFNLYHYFFGATVRT